MFLDIFRTKLYERSDWQSTAGPYWLFLWGDYENI
jgi:hypothetical protein